jgi:Protein of unknown function (DUF1524)
MADVRYSGVRGDGRIASGIRRFPRWAWILVAVAVVVIVAAVIVFVCVHRKPDPNPTNPWDKAREKLATLPVKGRAPKTGYSRDAFGPPWIDDVNVAGGHNGCDTRDDILRRDLTDRTSQGCTVLSGTLHDPYTDTTIPFDQDTPSIQIDHVVALEDAWQTGAQQLDLQTRQNFANDPLNLQATDGPTNQKKRDRDAASWLPPNKAYHCTYVTRQVDVKALYHLWVTPAEHDAIADLLRGCAATESIGPSTPGPVPNPPAPQGPHQGQFCSPPGATAVSTTGEPMVCSPAENFRNRWVTR